MSPDVTQYGIQNTFAALLSIFQNLSLLIYLPVYWKHKEERIMFNDNRILLYNMTSSTINAYAHIHAPKKDQQMKRDGRDVSIKNI